MNETERTLTARDYERFERSYITREMLIEARVYRVDNEAGADLVGQGSKNGRRFDGVVFPYMEPGSARVIENRLRRDEPDYEHDGKGGLKEKAKYLGPPQRRSHIYIPPLSWRHLEAKTVAIVEGEKKALALSRYFEERGEDVLVIGLAGVYAWSGPIGKIDHPTIPKKVWVKGLISELEALGWGGRTVMIIYDVNVKTNMTVRSARKKLTRHLVQRGARVHHIDLPDDIAEVNGIDDLLGIKGPEFVASILDQQLARAAIASLTFYASSEQDFTVLGHEVWSAIAEAETLNDRSLYWFAGNMIRTQPQGDRVKIEELTIERLSYYLSNLSKWIKVNKKGEYLTVPPPGLIKYMLAAPKDETPLPTLSHVVTAPVFTESGELLTRAGFHEESGIYYLPTFEVLPLPSEITPGCVAEAVQYIDKEILSGFPLEAQADRAHAFALFLLPFVRAMIPGPTPLHSVSAPIRGAGKGKLVQAMLRPALGSAGIHCEVQPEQADEWPKVISTALLGGKPALLIDNLDHKVDSGKLASALTTEHWDGRILGSNKSVSMPVRLIWVATGNNPLFSSEMLRRRISIRIVPPTDHPEDRDPNEFQHPEVENWVEGEGRPRIVQAAHIIVQAWINAGKPPGAQTLGSYERWAKTIGGILESAGIRGFLGNQAELRQVADMERLSRAGFCNEWYQRARDKKCGKAATSSNGDTEYRARVAELLPIAREIEGLPIHGNTEAGELRSLGKYLSDSAGIVPEHTERDEDGRELYTRRFRILKGPIVKRAVQWILRLESGPLDEPLSPAPENGTHDTNGANGYKIPF